MTLVYLLDAIKAEFAKTFSLRLPVFTAIATVVVTVLLSGVFTAAAKHAFAQGRPEEVLGLEPSVAFLFIVQYGQIGIILFGCWLVFQEHEKSALRTSFLATPKRGILLVAKTIVASSVSLLIAVVTVVGSYAARTFVVGDRALTINGIGDLRVLAGYVVYWTLLGVIAFAISVVVRNGLVAVGALITLAAGLSNFLVPRLPLARFLPDQAGAALTRLNSATGGDLTPALALIVLCGWVIGSLSAAGLSITTWEARS